MAAQSDSLPLVYKYDPETKIVMERKRAPNNWEYVIYNAYVKLREDFDSLPKKISKVEWIDFIRANPKFQFIDPDKPDDINDITYIWKSGRNQYKKLTNERVHIHIHNPNLPELAVIIMQPSWQGSNPDTWDDQNAALYIPKNPDYDKESGITPIIDAYNFWTTGGLTKFKTTNTKRRQNESRAWSQGGRRRKTRRTRRARRTRRK